jgi:hypothetical protein
MNLPHADSEAVSARRRHHAVMTNLRQIQSYLICAGQRARPKYVSTVQRQSRREDDKIKGIKVRENDRHRREVKL